MQFPQHFLRPCPVEVIIKVLKQGQQVPDLLLLVKIGLVRQVRHHGLAVRADGLAADGDRSRRGRQQPRRQLDKGGLAAAVWAQQTHDFPLGQLQVQIVQSRASVIPLGKPGCFQYAFHVYSSFSSSSSSCAA